MDQQRDPRRPMNEQTAGGPGGYEIRIRGHLDDRWAARFERLELTREHDGTTALRGAVPDQAALHGLLLTVRDLGMTLLSVLPLDGGEHSSITTPVTTCGDDASPTPSVAFESSPSAPARGAHPPRSPQ
jgi:hypothetical protein